MVVSLDNPPLTYAYPKDIAGIEAHHQAFLDHEHWVAASFNEAVALEPDLTCKEWARRHPFSARLTLA